MSIGDLEWLLTWASIEPPELVLRVKLADHTLDEMSVGQYLRKRAEDQALNFPPRLLKETADAFFGEMLEFDPQGEQFL